MLIFTVAALLPARGFADPGLIADPSGNIYRYWLSSGEARTGTQLNLAKSIDQGLTFSPPKNLFSFTQEVNSCELKFSGNQNLYCIYEVSGEVYLLSSHDAGTTFSRPNFLAAQGWHPTFAVSENLFISAWELPNGSLSLSRSLDQGLTWSSSSEIQVPGAVASSPSLVFDPFNKPHLLFVADNKSSRHKQIYYSPLITSEMKVIFESPDSISAPQISLNPWGITATWQSDRSGKLDNYALASLDGGTTFSRAVPTPPMPEILRPKDKSLTNSPTLEISYRLTSRDPLPLIIKIDLSRENHFPADKTWSFEQLCLGVSSEVSYRLPVDLDEGSYYLRLSATDGITAGPFTRTIEFRVDRTSPDITLSSPTEEAIGYSTVSLKGKISEPSFLFLNGSLTTSEVQTFFNLPVLLKPGKNNFIITAADAAGNSVSISKIISYSSLKPEIALLKPKESDWYKPGSTIHIKAKANDPQNDLLDESEGEISIAGKTLEDTLIFEQKAGELNGLITLPEELPEGKLPAWIKFSDTAGNTGEASFTINIDRTPPSPSQNVSDPVYASSSILFTLPIADAGAGIDPSGTIIKIAGISAEGSSTAESLSLSVISHHLLSDGTYAVEVTPRDQVGNTGKLAAFKLIIDTQAPKLTLLSTLEENIEADKVTLKGEVDDLYPAEVRILNNHKVVGTIKLTGKEFNQEVALLPGNNAIEIIASDQAGNTSSLQIKSFSNLRSSAAIVNTCSNGPNPFSPSRDGIMYFSYTLNSSANLKIYIFNLAGTLLWKKDYQNISSGNITWDGVDQFGITAGNGVYPYLLQFSSGGTIEIKRGKIIVLQP